MTSRSSGGVLTTYPSKLSQKLSVLALGAPSAPPGYAYVGKKIGVGLPCGNRRI